MSLNDKRLKARILNKAGDVDEKLWDRFAGTTHPFTRHGFITALEDSGSATAQSGWQPCHILLCDGEDNPCGLMPAYLKGHSYGEYVFDHSWANAYEQAGGRYYPKLQASIPFTPATGPRLLAESDAHRHALLNAAQNLIEQNQFSGLHITFAQEEEAALMADHGLLIREGEQFHWRNRGYSSFDDFLNALSSRKRKAIKKERREALSANLNIEILVGREICEHHWDAFFQFYIDTGNRKWGTPYLNRRFFSLMGERMGDAVVLMMAYRAGQPIAGALNLQGADALYGRYWGAIEHHPFLHFELCYYQAIDYAIEHGLKRVEAGAQGAHKIARGYEPVLTRSAHWLRDPGFHDAVERYLRMERREVESEVDYLSNFTPFKKG